MLIWIKSTMKYQNEKQRIICATNTVCYITFAFIFDWEEMKKENVSLKCSTNFNWTIFAKFDYLSHVAWLFSENVSVLWPNAICTLLPRLFMCAFAFFFESFAIVEIAESNTFFFFRMHKTISEIENKNINIEKTPDRCYLKRCQLHSLRETWLRQIQAHSLFTVAKISDDYKNNAVLCVCAYAYAYMCQISVFNHSFHFSYSLCKSFRIGFWFFSVFCWFRGKNPS